MKNLRRSCSNLRGNVVGTISIKNQPKIKSTTFFLNAYNHMKRGGRKYFGRLFWHLHHFITGYKENQ